MACRPEDDSEEFPSLSVAFDQQLEMYNKIEESSLPSSDSDFQIQVSECIKKLEELTIFVSRLGVFSSNEKLEELSTSSVKFLLLPVLLGSLTLKQVGPPRLDVLKAATVYFKDFLSRCREYEIASIEFPREKNVENGDEHSIPKSKIMRNGKPSPEELNAMARQREEKIKRYKMKKETGETLKELKKALENPSHDEEIVRDYHLTMIKQFIFTSLDELDSIRMEQQMLTMMNQRSKDNITEAAAPSYKPIKPFLITRDSAQKKVFGLGYPSLPVMSVEEFYEQRVKEGWFAANSAEAHKCPGNAPETRKEKDGDEESDEDIENLRQRDEWRDTHRKGWGNTYNRS